MKNNFLNEIKNRGIIFDITDYEKLDELLSGAKITLYCGFDPTADSLHVGHLLPIITLKRFQNNGHIPIALVGGATGLIGDPSFKANERNINPASIVEKWGNNINKQLLPFLDFIGIDNKAIMENNANWFINMNVLDFLRDIGKNFSVNAMMNKESVKQRLTREGVGISFTEFSYSLLQSYDFVELNKRYNCKLQIGGSDQWGNITAGIDLVRRLNHDEVFGITLPLVTKADGTKFGKTESGTIWLSAHKTSPYQFYQFWLNASDVDVYKFLRYFTFLTLDEITAIEQDDKNSNAKPKAQMVLADNITRLVHGEERLLSAKRISETLFSNEYSKLIEKDFEQLALDGLPSVIINKKINIIELLKLCNLAKSNNEARGFINQNAVLINETKVVNIDFTISNELTYFNKYIIIRKGKKNHCLVIWDSNE